VLFNQLSNDSDDRDLITLLLVALGSRERDIDALKRQLRHQQEPGNQEANLMTECIRRRGEGLKAQGDYLISLADSMQF
jgi:hypothetical protein